jgi:hypothetical protein
MRLPSRAAARAHVDQVADGEQVQVMVDDDDRGGSLRPLWHRCRLQAVGGSRPFAFLSADNGSISRLVVTGRHWFNRGFMTPPIWTGIGDNEGLPIS